MSLHHPIRMAEQMALIDNISRGRLVVGLGRGTAYNIYDYQGYGIDPDEAHERLLEAEDIMVKAWTTENFEHRGKFWTLRLPRLRPRPYTMPHPPIIRACASEEAMLDMARAGRPFLMNVQTNEVTRHRMDLLPQRRCASAGSTRPPWRATSPRPGSGAISSWPRPTPRPSASRARPSRPRPEFRQAMRKRVYEEQGVLLKPGDGARGAQRPAALAPVRLARHRGGGHRRRSTRSAWGG